MNKQKLAVRLMKEDVAGRPVHWNVECTGTCGNGIHEHMVYLNRGSGIWTCSCPGNTYQGAVCKHIRSAYASALREETGYTASFVGNLQAARRQRRTVRNVKAGKQIVYACLRKGRQSIFSLKELR